MLISLYLYDNILSHFIYILNKEGNMLQYIETHVSNISKTEDVYNENKELLFTIHYIKNKEEKHFEIDYVRAHTSLGAEFPLETIRQMEIQENQKNVLPERVLSLKEKRTQDPDWTECKKAAKLLLKRGLRSQVKALLREYNKTHSMN